jgi:hypothetical protein
MTVQVGDVSPTETEPLRDWLLALPDKAILRDRKSTACQRGVWAPDFPHADDSLVVAGNHRSLKYETWKIARDNAPLTVIWLPTAAEPPAAP